MKSTLCLLCGERLGKRTAKLSRHAMLCASCSSMLDGFQLVPRLPEAIPLPSQKQGERRKAA